MKKFILLSPPLLLTVLVTAQSYESVKNILALQQYKTAKEELDKAMSNPKFTSKPEAYILKTAIYSGMAMDVAAKGTPAEEQLITEAEMAFKRYRDMDPSLSLLNDPLYQNAPVNIYSALFSAGYRDYESKNWEPGFQKFKKVVEYSDLLISKKMISIPADTNSLLLAGITAESAGIKDEAVKYYGRIADLKVGGRDFEGIYRFLVNYYATKKDMQKFEKYKATGKELYPQSQFFTYDKVDFAVGRQNDFTKRIKALEELITDEPANYKANLLLGQLIYDTLNSQREGAIQPSNAPELEIKMLKAFNRAATVKPGDELPFIYTGNHFINKSIRANTAREAQDADTETNTKPGTTGAKEGKVKSDALDQEYSNALEKARESYEKAAAIFAKKGSLAGQDKSQYKKISGYLRDIYMVKKNRAKEKAAQLKYLSAEKKWNEVYDSIEL
jgi:hypothetical protein